MRRSRGKENHVVSISGELTDSGRLAQDALAPVAKDRIAQPLSGDEGNPARRSLSRGEHANAEEGVIKTPPPREDPLEVTSGLDGPHGATLHGQALAALRATAGKDGAAALGSHTGTEAVRGGALALVGLIRTLHVYSSRLGYERPVRAISSEIVRVPRGACQFQPQTISTITAQVGGQM